MPQNKDVSLPLLAFISPIIAAICNFSRYGIGDHLGISDSPCPMTGMTFAGFISALARLRRRGRGAVDPGRLFILS